VAQRAGTKQPGRTSGALKAVTGQVHYREGYLVGRQQVIQFYRQLDHADPAADRLYVIQDNGNIPTHPEGLSAGEQYPRIPPVWWPTYAPWLNPMEKLWRWLRQDGLKRQRWVEDWPQVKQRVHDFLDQFAQGAPDLLRSVGLMGKGKLATIIETS
jgi:transposase